MNVKNVALQAYKTALDGQKALEGQIRSRVRPNGQEDKGFGSMLTDSLKNVNELQSEKKAMIEEFASGKTENVHELMITMQKASLAMSMTSTVRNKIMTAYQEILRMPF